MADIISEMNFVRYYGALIDVKESHISFTAARLTEIPLVREYGIKVPKKNPKDPEKNLPRRSGSK